jgi:hypothetical protein
MTARTMSVLGCLVVVLLVISAPSWSKDKYIKPLTNDGPSWPKDISLQPFVLAYRGAGTIETKLVEVKSAVEREGFQVVGEYAPFKGAYVVVVTSDALRNNAVKSTFGAYGAVQRIALSQVSKEELQVAYTNPRYMAQAYRMKDDLGNTAAKLQKALGKMVVFGSKEGFLAEKLRTYQYMCLYMFMPAFTDHIALARYPSQEEALQVLESNLAEGKGGTTRVYRVDLPGKRETVLGVGMRAGAGADETIMKAIDIGELKSLAHLPYELIVSDGTIYMLNIKFRNPVNFPDLSMGTFMAIKDSPADIEQTFRQVAGGTENTSFGDCMPSR